MRNRLLFIISGPSGVGKGTVISAVLSHSPRLAKVITYTSRAPREGEENHVTYHFISSEEFEEKIQQGFFFEWEKVYKDAYYGSPKNPFESMPDGYDALLEIGAGGMKDYLSSFREAITIFLAPPSMDALLDRIEKRGGGETNLDNRLNSAIEMIREADHYDYVLVNDDLQRTVNRIACIIEVERHKAEGREIARCLVNQAEEWMGKRS